jgi:hypothetical protein
MNVPWMVPGREVVAHWPVAALLCPLVFAAIGPVTVSLLPPALFVILAQLPLYMTHQVEEHANDRFRSFINARFGAGVLSAEAVAVINLPGVWGVMLLGFALAAFAGPGWGLVAPYLSLINALIHVAAFVALRGYNPGLVTALVLLLPGGALGLALVPGTVVQHALALGAVLAIHAAIVAHVKRRAASLGAATLRAT